MAWPQIEIHLHRNRLVPVGLMYQRKVPTSGAWIRDSIKATVIVLPPRPAMLRRGPMLSLPRPLPCSLGSTAT